MNNVSSAALWSQGHWLVPHLLEEPLLGFLHRYLVSKSLMPAESDSQVPGTPAFWGDPVMEHVLLRLLPQVEVLSGRLLYPTYAYGRVYKHGDVLAPHVDRPACEISVTLNLGQQPNEPWPIWVEGAGGPVQVKLMPGDGLMYRGIDCAHWRNAYEGEQLAQVFFHYVDQNGPYAHWKYDQRPCLNLVPPLPI
jgi:hypothetical protein